MVDQSNATDAIDLVDTSKLGGRTSSFSPATNAVFKMHEISYSLPYSFISKDGGISYGDHSHMAMISILRSNSINKKNKSNIKPIGTLCFKEAIKEIKYH
ncbi:MAG: hypothetical protein P1P69_00010 [Methanosarcinaceae archaeon]|nr:hypothetical protein [Methanosarcinaceae archaeon]